MDSSSSSSSSSGSSYKVLFKMGSLDVASDDSIPQRITSDGLFIGSAAAVSNTSILFQLKISHVLSAAPNFTCDERLTQKSFDILDLPEYDIVSHFPECFDFIERGQRAGGILVHCVAGVSRSAAICIGYLMKAKGWTYKRARTEVSKARPWISPNSGFDLQLRSYEKQLISEGVIIKPKQPASSSSSSSSPPSLDSPTPLPSLPEDSASSQSIESVRIAEAVSTKGSKIVEFLCSKCRQILFKPKAIVKHEIPEQPRQFGKTKRMQIAAPECTSIFVDSETTREWMNMDENEGKILCPNPKCKQKLGSWNWSGMQCSCSQWIVPAVQFSRGKVDPVYNRIVTKSNKVIQIQASSSSSSSAASSSGNAVEENPEGDK